MLFTVILITKLEINFHQETSDPVDTFNITCESWVYLILCFSHVYLSSFQTQKYKAKPAAKAETECVNKSDSDSSIYLLVLSFPLRTLLKWL